MEDWWRPWGLMSAVSAVLVLVILWHVGWHLGAPVNGAGLRTASRLLARHHRGAPVMGSASYGAVPGHRVGCGRTVEVAAVRKVEMIKNDEPGTAPDRRWN
jgi:hypothetical protein